MSTGLELTGSLTITVDQPDDVGTNHIDDSYNIHYSTAVRSGTHGTQTATYYIEVETDINGLLTFYDSHDSYSLTETTFSSNDTSSNDVTINLPSHGGISVPVGSFKVDLPSPNPPTGSGASAAAYKTGTNYNDTGEYNIIMTLGVDNQGDLTATTDFDVNTSTVIEVVDDHELAQKLAVDFNGTINNVSENDAETLSVTIEVNDIESITTLTTKRDTVIGLYNGSNTITSWSMTISGINGNPDDTGGNTNNTLSAFARSDPNASAGPTEDTNRGANGTNLFPGGAFIVLATPFSYGLTVIDGTSSPATHTLISAEDVYGVLKQSS